MGSAGFDCVSSNLFCLEDNDILMDFEDAVNDENGQHHEEIYQNQSLSGVHLTDFSFMDEEVLEIMIKRETEYLPMEAYIKRLQSRDFDFFVRREAIDWIQKVLAYYNFGPLSAYLSINYLDRFLSTYELPKGKAWIAQLLPLACLSIAAKMEETEVPMTLDLQVGESKFLFGAKTIQRMELLVLTTLKWRMQAVTPFSFIDNFLQRINDKSKPTPRSYLSQSIRLILNTIKGTDYLVFRPSEIAAAVALCVSRENQGIELDNALTCFNLVNKKNLLRCYEQMQDMGFTRKHIKNACQASSSSVPQIPIGVLDVGCISCRSNEITAEPYANCLNSSPFVKKRKLNKMTEVQLNS